MEQELEEVLMDRGNETLLDSYEYIGAIDEENKVVYFNYDKREFDTGDLERIRILHYSSIFILHDYREEFKICCEIARVNPMPFLKRISSITKKVKDLFDSDIKLNYKSV